MQVTPPLSENTAPDNVVLFADVSGSTHLYEVLGDARAFAAIDDCLTLLTRLTVTNKGRVIKTIGDEIMAVFPDAVCAAQAACEMQLAINAKPPIDTLKLAIRIGFHIGPVLKNEGDVFGDTVNVAARMTEIAKARQIITTGITIDSLPPIMRSGTRKIDKLSIKGKTDDLDVFEVIWLESEEMTMMVGNTFQPGFNETVLHLAHRGDRFCVDATHPGLTVGRDDAADIIVEDKRASRMHARIERRRDKFVLVDMSSNGSYILFRDGTEIQLRREEVVLRQGGKISLGHSYQKDPTEVIEFSVQIRS